MVSPPTPPAGRKSVILKLTGGAHTVIHTFDTALTPSKAMHAWLATQQGEHEIRSTRFGVTAIVNGHHYRASYR